MIRGSFDHHRALRLPRQSSAPPPREDACKPFEEGDETSREFYSPGWPGTYPNHTECVRILEGKKQAGFFVIFVNSSGIADIKYCQYNETYL